VNVIGDGSRSRHGGSAPTTDERRLVSVVFVDVVGSTRLAEGLDPEDWKALINGAFTALTIPIHRYEGTVAQYLGDGFLAFFGAPVAHEDDATRSVRAGLEVVEAARNYASDVRQRFGLEFAVRVGIHTGPVVVGDVGTDLRREYLAVGDTVNVAARLQSQAQPMAVLISDSTKRLVSDGFALDDAGVVEIRGRVEPIRTFAPRRTTSGPDVLRDELSYSAVPMIGRTDELERLLAATDATRAGVGRLVVLVGEPGIGKSRLLREWRVAADRGVRWTQANMPAHASSVAYYLAGEVIRAMLELTREADSQALDEVIRRSDVDGTLSEGRALLASLLSIGLADADPSSPHLTPLGRQARYLQLIRAVACARSQEPHVVALNDVHWSDPSSVALLGRLMELHAELPLLVCVVARPDSQVPGWRLVEAARESAGAGIVEISLEALPRDQASQLVGQLLGGDVPDELTEFVVRRTDGNPLFIEETVRMLVERRFVTRHDGASRFEGRDADDIPANLQGLLAARIDRLEPHVRHALRVASVIGRTVPVGVLDRLLTPDGVTTPVVLACLEREGLMRLARTEPSVEFTFRHQLIHDAAYRSLPREQRRDLHRAVAELLEENSAEQVDELADTLAYHFSRGGEPASAAEYQLRAADRAARSFANDEAIHHFGAALKGDAAHLLPPQRRAQAYERFGDVLELAGRIGDAVAAFERVRADVLPDDTFSEARIDRKLGNAHRIGRDIDLARAAFSRAEERLEALPVDRRGKEWWREWLDLMLDRAWLHHFWGPHETLAELLEACGSAVREHATDLQRTRYFAALGLLRLRGNHMLELDEALTLTRTAYDAWQATGDPTDAETVRFQLGFCHVWRREFDAGEFHLRGSLASAVLTGDVVLQSRCLTYLALAARFRGDPDGMEQILVRAMPILIAGGMLEYQAMAAGNRCWASWRRGDTQAARRHGAEAQRISAQLPGTYPGDGIVRLPLLAMALDEDDLPAAVAHARELNEGIWPDVEYGDALRAGLDAQERGDALEAHRRLRVAVGRASLAGWL
jgi:class 3 adenylate cyclase/tetratricopeptide (TPR) repeat protein